MAQFATNPATREVRETCDAAALFRAGWRSSTMAEVQPIVSRPGYRPMVCPPTVVPPPPRGGGGGGPPWWDPAPTPPNAPIPIPDPVTSPRSPGPGQIGPPAVIALSSLAVAARVAVLSLLRRAGIANIYLGARVAWTSLPTWVRQGLVAVGVLQGADIMVDWWDVGQEEGDGLSLEEVAGVKVASSWTANGRKFYRLSDGRLATQKNNKVWTLWRPKRPVVLMPSGPADMQAYIRADRIMDRMAVKLAKALRRRGYDIRKKVSPRRDPTGCD